MKRREGALPDRWAEFSCVQWDRPLRAVESNTDWIQGRGGIDMKEGGGAGLRRRDLG